MPKRQYFAGEPPMTIHEIASNATSSARNDPVGGWMPATRALLDAIHALETEQALARIDALEKRPNS